jgi:two-component system OmpR family response regulator
MFRIIVVDDDMDINKSVCLFLEQNGYEVKGCLSADEAFNEMYGSSYDLVISDIMMPKIDGYELTRQIRRENADIPILFMTARDDFSSKQTGFRAGIDDYMVKPVDLNELLLHVEALLRRAKIAASRKISTGSLELDADAHTAFVNGNEIPLTVREFNLLFKLLSFPNKTFTRVQLMDEFWDDASDASTRTVDVYMTRLRNKFSECHDFEIATVHGLGYKAVVK